MAITPAPRGVRYLSVGHASRVHRGDIPYWEQAERIGINNPDILRSLERGTRPLTDVARQVIERLHLDVEKLDRDLARAEADELADVPLLERVLLRDMFLVSLRRYKVTGEMSRLRAETAPVGKTSVRRTKASRKDDARYNEKPSRDSSVGRAAVIPTRRFPAFEIVAALAA